MSPDDLSAARLDLAEVPDAKAPFIAFDGIDGSGKSTLVDATRRLLEDRGLEVVVTRSPPRHAVERPLYLRYLHEPETRDAIDYRGLSVVPMGERLQHACETIIPALRSRTAVVCDRYVYSAAAHLLARGFRREPWFLDLCRHLPRPTHTFHVCAPLEINLARVAARGNGVDGFVEHEYFASLHEAYRTIATANNLEALDTTDELDRTIAQISARLDQVERTWR